MSEYSQRLVKAAKRRIELKDAMEKIESEFDSLEGIIRDELSTLPDTRVEIEGYRFSLVAPSESKHLDQDRLREALKGRGVSDSVLEEAWERAQVSHSKKSYLMMTPLG